MCRLFGGGKDRENKEKQYAQEYLAIKKPIGGEAKVAKKERNRAHPRRKRLRKSVRGKRREGSRGEYKVIAYHGVGY